MDMKHVKYLALVLCIGNLSPVMAQTASKSLTVDNLVAWQRISGQAISDNGKWVASSFPCASYKFTTASPSQGSILHATHFPLSEIACHFSAGGPFSFLGFFRLFGCVAETRQDDSGFSENKENEERKDADGCIGHLFAFGRQGSD